MKKGRKWFALLLLFAMLLTSVGTAPVKVQAAKLITVTVGTQQELEAALKNAKVGKIVISTKAKVTLTIPEGTRSNKKNLVINAPNAAIVNNESFKEITIEALKKFTENGKGNEIVVRGKKVDFTVSPQAAVKSVTSSGAYNKLTIEKGAKLDSIITKGKGTKVSLAQDVIVKRVTLIGKNTSLALDKGATINTTEIWSLSANLKVAEGAAIEAVSMKKKGAVLNIVADGKATIDILEKAFISLSGTAKQTTVNIDKKAEGTVLDASAAIMLSTKVSADITLKAGAESSALRVTDARANVAVKNKTKQRIEIETPRGTINVGIGEEIETEAYFAVTPTPMPIAAPNEEGDSIAIPTLIPVDKNGFDEKGRMVAYFGTPSIDGTVDKVWEKAVPVTVKDAAGKTDTTAEFRVLWDDNALYVLANVKDSALDAKSGNVYEKDSAEVFLDEKNDKTKDFGVDDLHFRVNFKNEQSADNGDLSRFYTYAKTVDGGYLVEARVALTDKPVKNDKVYGFELQINDAKDGRRLTSLHVFDQTGMAYADTGLFGELLLAGKATNYGSGLNPYDLMNLVASSKKIMLERYTNGNVVKELINASEAAIKDANTTQKKIDDLYKALEKAVEDLIHDDKDYDEKECRQVPVKYKTIDEHQGTIERVSYNTNSYDAKNEARVKDFLVYLPHGYNANDKTMKYNVLYLIHGMGENQDTVFGGPGQNTDLMKILDNMIYNKQLEPLIVVTPTWSYQGNSGDFSVIFSQSENFHNELVKDIIPTVEAKYNTYAASTSEKDLIAAREHRALAGFSMGSATTWYTLVKRVEYFKYYMPISAGYTKNSGLDEFTGTAEEKTAQYLRSIAREAGYGPNDVSIFCATGTEDMAYGGMVNLVNAMKKVDDTFLYSANLNKGNFYFLALEGGTHIWNCVNRYLYNMLPDLFNSKKITFAAPSPIPVDANGLDADGRMVAYFGTPSIDGTVDKVWEKAVPVTVKDAAGKTDTTAEFRVLWDDNALYVLANVKDSALDAKSGSVYEKDSAEVFLDEKNDKTKDYGVDDLHFRVNFKNEQSADNGDLSRFYTCAKIVDGGYIVEARVALTDKQVMNGKVYGFDLQINDAKNGSRITTLHEFDQTGMAYADTGLFGELLLAGKAADALSGLNPYDLMNLVDSSKKIMLERYTNGNVVQGLITASEAAIKDMNTTQKLINNLYKELEKAVDNLIHDDKDYDDKECRQVPVKYKKVDEHQGTIERVTYNTNSYDSKNEARVKDFLVYLPNGYDAADTTKKYNVLYLIHGMGENQDTVFGGPGQNTELMKILDNMIYNKQLEPLIVVTPTWSYQGNSGDFSVIFSQSENFHNELVKDIIPTVEAKYNTYAASTSEKDLIAAREHRALAGFSMGSATTWYTFVKRIEYFKYYMPISAGYTKNSGLDEFTGTAEEKTAQYLESIVKEAGYGPNDVSIFCATGTEDMAYGGMVNLVNAMKKVDDTFLYTANLNKGNFYFLALEGGTHIWNCVNRYLYNMLPDLFNSKKITLAAPSPIPVNENGFDGAGQIVGYFGTPVIDGVIDPIWDKAVQVSTVQTTKTPVVAKYKLLWDDKAIYFLAQVEDSELNGTATNVYDRDSVEIFLDENYNRSVNYSADDLHFRVGYDNKQSADNGDMSRLYSKTSIVDGGYIVEARISLLKKPVNDTVYGIDLSVNDGKNGSKVGAAAVFDQNNEAYKDTSKFGAIILSGRAQGAVSGLNPYDLMNAIAEGRQIKLERYTNGAVAAGLITDAEAALQDVNVTQKIINDLYKKLRAAIDGLIHDDKSYDEKECRMIPGKYRTVDEHQGTIERVAYTTNSYDSANETLDKDMLVYLPAGYNAADTTTKYNVLYLIHGLSENQNTVFGGPGENTELMKIVDNMIYNKKLEPMIIVTPTWAYKGDSDFMQAFFNGRPANFHQELVKDIIPAIETKYNTYAASSSEADLIAARDHRAVAGFSMGSSATWYTFINQIKYFKYYMPLSLSCQVYSGLDMYEGTTAEKRAQYLESIAEAAGYGPNDFSIFGATGTEDTLAYADMAPQMEAMKKLNATFMNSTDFTKGNFYFMLLEGGTHIWNCVNRYLYNMLPDLFNGKTIDPAIIPVKLSVSFDKNDGTGIITTKKANTSGYIKLLTTQAQMPGAELVGWSTAADSTQKVQTEANGTYKVTENTTLYAIWKWSEPSVVSSVSPGAISVDTSAVQAVKIAVGVTGSAITVSGSAITVSGPAITVSGPAITANTIIANANEGFTLNVTKDVNSSVTGKYIIQYAAVDMNIEKSEIADGAWKDITFEGNNAVVDVAASAENRKIYIRVASGEGCKFLNSDAVPLEMKN